MRSRRKAAEAEAKSEGRPKQKLSKNSKTNVMGDRVGRVFVGRPDFGKLKQIQMPLLHRMQRQESAKKRVAKRDPATNAE